MLLTRNGRFNNDSFYTEAPRFSQDNAYNNALLTQIKNALKTNFNIDESSLAKWEKKYKLSGKLPKDVIAKKATTPAAVSQGAPEQATGTPDIAVQPQTDTQPATNPNQSIAQAALKNIKSESVKWADIVSRIGNNPIYYSITPNDDGTFNITENKTGSMLVAYDSNITESMSTLYLVPNPVSFNKPELFKNGVPDAIKPYFDVSGNGLISMVKPVAFIAENKSGPWKIAVKGFIELTENDIRPLKKTIGK
jgi:hypothetical protein